MEDGLGNIGGAHTSNPQLSRGMVLIHGAGIWQPDYWRPIVDRIKQLLGGDPAAQFGAIGVHYSDVIDAPRTISAQPTALAPQQFQDTFLNELLRDQLMATVGALSPTQLLEKITAALLPGGNNLLAALYAAPGIASITRTPDRFLDLLTRALLGLSLDQLRDQICNTLVPGGANVKDTIQDVYLYLYDEHFAKQVRQQLIDGLHQAQQYDQVVLVSHSLGTVIAFDVLNAWTESTPKISHWFTLGCPLTKILRLRPGTPNRLQNADVTHWYNVYDTTDPIGGALGPAFTKPGYNIYDVFVDIARDPVASHDYFDNSTALEIIADVMRWEV